ncbi:N-6 DNA methylase [Synechococcus sp. FACHB-909]|uniref:Eco57I restriction-modification methylase domain-containing protein n=1 Tax=Synechococcus sp. FACHB-909 TaxID=2692863 RepID=UPI001684D925|nr:N-6 DNA methylase [Synechococcus sp. FACHB-909]MBD2720139.1 N-6 DNA methylase [Synechococcus sp. FACHB-909]
MVDVSLADSDSALQENSAALDVLVSRIIHHLSLESSFAISTISALEAKASQIWGKSNPWFALWREHCKSYFDIEQADTILGEIMPPTSHGCNLFFAQSYCALLLNWIMEILQIEGNDHKPIYSGTLFGWLECITLASPIELDALLSTSNWQYSNKSSVAIKQFSNFLARLYQEVMPPQLRHLLGEYYTPSWLIDYAIGNAHREIERDKRNLHVLDPAVGSGGFLAHYAADLADSGQSIEARLCGFDINPVAVLFCTANLRYARAVLSGSCVRIEFDVRLADSVVDPVIDYEAPLLFSPHAYSINLFGNLVVNDESLVEATQEIVSNLCLLSNDKNLFRVSLLNYIDDFFSATKNQNADVLVGNPPWISWDGLSPIYRERVAPQWSTSSLFTSKGWNAKVAAGKTDFSSLFVYRSAERFASPNAIMIFVLPLSLFQSRLSGQGFRSFKTSSGRSFRLIRLDDFSKVKVFPDAVNRTSLGVFRLDGCVSFPIQYNRWARSNNGQFTNEEATGGPINPRDPTSPIVQYDKGSSSLDVNIGKSDYRARGGVNTGGANTILQLNLLAERGEFVTIQNTGKSRRSSSKIITAEVESAVVFPLLCGTDMKKWKACPSKRILLMYDPAHPKKAIQANIARELYPKAFSFLCQFKSSLESRKEYHRWGCSGPFYEVYRIGPYTFSPIKVVWQHTGYKRSLNISVLDDSGDQITIPDQKAIIIPCESSEEAHYICAFLGSDVVSGILNRYLGTDASTHIMDYISMRKYNSQSVNHLELSSLSVTAHKLAGAGLSTIGIEAEINKIVSELLSGG